MIAFERTTAATPSTTCYALLPGLRGGVFVCVEPAHGDDVAHVARGRGGHPCATWYGDVR